MPGSKTLFAPGLLVKMAALTLVFWGFWGSAARAGEVIEPCDGHWRDYAYDTKIMKRYKPYAKCVRWTAHQFELPEELLYSIIYVERGDVNGKCMTNNNGTEDCGPAQINDVRLGEIKRFDLSKDDMKDSPCRNIWVMGYLIRREIEKAGGDIWKGVGNYHYHYSVNQTIHDRYVKLISDAWRTLNHNVAARCDR